MSLGLLWGRPWAVWNRQGAQCVVSKRDHGLFAVCVYEQGFRRTHWRLRTQRRQPVLRKTSSSLASPDDKGGDILVHSLCTRHREATCHTCSKSPKGSFFPTLCVDEEGDLQVRCGTRSETYIPPCIPAPLRVFAGSTTSRRGILMASLHRAFLWLGDSAVSMSCLCAQFIQTGGVLPVAEPGHLHSPVGETKRTPRCFPSKKKHGHTLLGF